MSKVLTDALKQATELVQVVNKLIPTAENLTNVAIQKATKELKGEELKAAQKKLMQVKQLTIDAKKGMDIAPQVKELTKEVKETYKK